MKYVIGLSLGQTIETSGLAIGERSGDESVTCSIRHLERFAAGTSYPEIVDRLASLLAKDPMGGAEVLLAVDATAAARPIVDMFGALPVARIIGVTVTGGDSEARDCAWARVPKRILVSTVQMLLQTGRLKIAPALSDAAGLVSDLSGFSLKQPELLADSNAMLWRESSRDDLVFAVALSSWLAVGYSTWYRELICV
ncbi:MAG TPA: hypothetical protein VEV81_14080 [Pyrinomonadaceae bacterium]|nr:hypothetical protein [Pyrinomonadaceae bacterium]